MDQTAAAPVQPDAAPDMPGETKALGKRQQKAVQKLQKRLGEEFAEAMDTVQKHHESRMQQGGAAGQLAKERRKALRDVLKAVNDSSTPLEERVRLLQARYVGVLQEQLRQDQQVLDLQEQLEGSRMELDAGRAELARSQQKVEGLQKLARSLTADNKVLSDEASRLRQSQDKVQDLFQNIQTQIDDQQQETRKVLEQNRNLGSENTLLQAQLHSTQELLTTLRTTQQDRISALAEQLQQQNDAMSKAAQVHEAMNALLEENKALTQQASLANTFKEHNEVLEKALSEARAQSTVHKGQMQEMQESLKKATKVVQSFDKMQKSMSEQHQLMTQLMQERQHLQQQVALLQQQGREQADKLRRTQLQKQRLEGLCRTLQARAGGVGAPAAGAGADLDVQQACSDVDAGEEVPAVRDGAHSTIQAGSNSASETEGAQAAGAAPQYACGPGDGGLEVEAEFTSAAQPDAASAATGAACVTHVEQQCCGVVHGQPTACDAVQERAAE